MTTIQKRLIEMASSLSLLFSAILVLILLPDPQISLFRASVHRSKSTESIVVVTRKLTAGNALQHFFHSFEAGPYPTQFDPIIVECSLDKPTNFRVAEAVPYSFSHSAYKINGSWFLVYGSVPDSSLSESLELENETYSNVSPDIYNQPPTLDKADAVYARDIHEIWLNKDWDTDYCFESESNRYKSANFQSKQTSNLKIKHTCNVFYESMSIQIGADEIAVFSYFSWRVFATFLLCILSLLAWIVGFPINIKKRTPDLLSPALDGSLRKNERARTEVD